MGVNMTAITNAIGKTYALANGFLGEADSGPITIMGKLLEIGKNLFVGHGQYDASLDHSDGSSFAGEFGGKPVYALSNEAIGRLLDAHGDPGHGRGAINYGAAYQNRIYVNRDLVEGAADNGVADPLSINKLRYVLEHELSHVNGFEEDGAHEIARRKTGLAFNGSGFVRYE
jgi:hypothetical protein